MAAQWITSRPWKRLASSLTILTPRAPAVADLLSAYKPLAGGVGQGLKRKAWSSTPFLFERTPDGSSGNLLHLSGIGNVAGPYTHMVMQGVGYGDGNANP